VLYLDASALVKRYVRDRGSGAVHARFNAGERIFTSVLSYAEIQTVLGRKHQSREMTRRDYEATRERFLHDWLFSLNLLAVDENTMAALPTLVECFPLKALDAVHLAAAHWLRDMTQLTKDFGPLGEKVEFGVSDRSLARIARECGFTVFDPERSL